MMVQDTNQPRSETKGEKFFLRTLMDAGLLGVGILLAFFVNEALGGIIGFIATATDSLVDLL